MAGNLDFSPDSGLRRKGMMTSEVGHISGMHLNVQRTTIWAKGARCEVSKRNTHIFTPCPDSSQTVNLRR